MESQPDRRVPEQEAPVLVVGAGPAGLTAALELTRLGRAVRIVDRRAARSERSKAIGVNARTLELLEPSGVTSLLLDAGVRYRGVRFRSAEGTGFDVDFGWLDHRYGFMLGLPQSETEALLERRLDELGVRVEREAELTDLTLEERGVRVELRAPSGAPERATFSRLIGADGAHSTVRRTLGIGFPGTTLSPPWSLADVRLSTDLSPLHAHVHTSPERMVFLIAFGSGLWRVASDRPDVLSHLPAGTTAGAVLWQSEFEVAFRRAERFAIGGRVFLCGDAAHVHSPLGARGMNLGIEDAAALARRLHDGTAAGYDGERRPFTGRVIRMVRAQTWMATHHGPTARVARGWVLPWLTRRPTLRRRLVRRMAGMPRDGHL